MRLWIVRICVLGEKTNLNFPTLLSRWKNFHFVLLFGRWGVNKVSQFPACCCYFPKKKYVNSHISFKYRTLFYYVLEFSTTFVMFTKMSRKKSLENYFSPSHKCLLYWRNWSKRNLGSGFILICLFCSFITSHGKQQQWKFHLSLSFAYSVVYVS